MITLDKILLVLFLLSVIIFLATLSATVLHFHVNDIFNRDKNTPETEDTPQIIQKYKVLGKILKEVSLPKLCKGKAYCINDEAYSGTFICNHVYMCDENFYPNGIELHITVIKPNLLSIHRIEGERITEFGTRLTFCVHRSRLITPTIISTEDRLLLKVIRG